MIGKSAAIVAGVAAVAVAPVTYARTVAYTLDRVAIEAAAEDQGIEGPFSDAPAPPPYGIALEAPTAADHDVKIVSIYCQAYKINNPLSVLMQQLLPPSTKVANPKLTLHLIKGFTLLRCLGNGELKVICKNEVKITAEIQYRNAEGSAVTRPVIASVEREGRVGGFCGNIARYTEIVSREAGIALIAKARAIYEQDGALN